MSSENFRLRFPEDEARFPWLSLLLNFYSIVDEAVALAIKSSGRTLACKEGCGACCRSHKDIPVYPHELVGITWYSIEKLHTTKRDTLISQLSSHKEGCPFLSKDSCLIHPLRPAACRVFNVADRPCTEGEDAFHTRPQDVIAPSVEEIRDAFSVIMPFYGITDEAEISEAVEAGYIHEQATPLQSCNWKGLAAKMQGR